MAIEVAPTTRHAGVRSLQRHRRLRLAPSARSTSRGRVVAFLVTIDALALVAAVAVLGAWDVAAGAYAVVALAILVLSGEYRPRITLRALDEAPRLAGRLAAPLLLVGPFTLVVGVPSSLFWVALLAVPFVVAGRVLSYTLVRRARRRGAIRTNTVVLGAGEVGTELVELLRAHPEFGLHPLGFLDRVDDTGLPAPLLGDVSDLERTLKASDVGALVVAFGPTREADLVEVLRTATQYEVEVYVVPRFFDVGVAPEGPDTDDVWGFPLYRVRRAALRNAAWRGKRAVDVLVSTVALVLASPILAVAAVGVRLSSSGPVLFRQKRIGQHGGEFEMLKFRTLPVDHVDQKVNADSGEYTIWWGRMLRKTSIDELPQLWNVLRGDMSLVGPRPERGYLVSELNDSVYGYRARHRLPVGLTGWAQVHGLRGDSSLDERARFDNQYIEHWSPWRDVTIMARTGTEILRGHRRS